MQSIQQYEREFYRLHPLTATLAGRHEWNDRCGDPHSDATRAKTCALRRWVLAELGRARALTLPMQLFVDMLDCADTLDDDAAQCVMMLRPQENLCYAVSDLLASAQPLHTADQRKRCLARLRQLPAALDTYFRVLERHGERHNPDVVREWLRSLQSLLAAPPYRKRLERHADVSEAAARHFEAPLREHLVRWTTYRAAPAPSTHPGAKTACLGAATYWRFVRHHTSLRSAADFETVVGPEGMAYRGGAPAHETAQVVTWIHDYGVHEVDRLERALRRLPGPADERVLTGEATIVGHYTRRLEELLRSPALKAFFGTLARVPACRVVPIPEHRAAASPLGYYQDNVFYVNTALPHQVRGADALLLHETVPGHHLQISLSERPPATFCQLCHHIGFEEGWAVYAESVLGWGSDPRGILESELFRACRLVVDTGLHAYGWTVAQAETYLRTHAPGLSPEEVRNEVRRYLSDPGQALAYGLGLLVLRRVSAGMSPEERKRWHGALLKAGSRPLWMLVEDWKESANDVRRAATPRAAAYRGAHRSWRAKPRSAEPRSAKPRSAKPRSAKPRSSTKNKRTTKAKHSEKATKPRSASRPQNSRVETQAGKCIRHV